MEAKSIADNLAGIRDRIARAASNSGRRAEDIAIVAVSKTFPAEAIRAAHQLGLRHFGENRVQEWEGKRKELAGVEATWHLIGHLQSNKARRAAGLFGRVDSVDHLGLAQKLDAAAAAEQCAGKITGVSARVETLGNKASFLPDPKLEPKNHALPANREGGSARDATEPGPGRDEGVREGKQLGVLIEVSLGNEVTKSGVAEAELPGLAEGIAALAHLELLGLMTIPPLFDDAERVRPFFAKLRGLRDDLRKRLGRALPVLSMGMSQDFDIGIEEGATEVRVGTALFGDRSARP